MRRAIKYVLACTPALLGVTLLILGCDQEYPGGLPTDINPEITVDTGTEVPADVPVEVAEEPVPDPGVDTTDCTYPAGPYAYTAIGDTVGPASWSTAIQAPTETFDSPTADFEDFYCDPSVESIVLFLATQS